MFKIKSETLLEAALFFFIVSFFLTLGSDFSSQVSARMFYGGALFFVFLLFFLRRNRFVSLNTAAALSFLAFIFFEILRSLWAAGVLMLRGVEVSRSVPVFRYAASPLKWSFYLAYFMMSFLLFRDRTRVKRLLWILSLCGFVLAFNAIPPLLIKGHAGYLLESGELVFFHPLFYFHNLAKKYLIGTFAHVNYTGDIIALGFFPSLGLLFYSLRRFSLSSFAYPALIALTTAGGVVLFLSRGTILSFVGAFLIYLWAMTSRFPSRLQLMATGFVFLLVLGFLLWAGNLRGALKEVETVSGEFDKTNNSSSFAGNREGARRALTIYQLNPIWGAGTEGYADVSRQFAAPGTERFLANDVVLCHYLQVLAEEGAGAFLYFLFLGLYFFEAVQGLLRATSRFQFMAGLSLFASVLMVMIHASVNQLMQRFSISMPIYIFMGASLGVLSKDFDHA